VLSSECLCLEQQFQAFRSQVLSQENLKLGVLIKIKTTEINGHRKLAVVQGKCS
jgi:hypothetical protein